MGHGPDIAGAMPHNRIYLVLTEGVAITTYIIRRLIHAIPLLLLISVVVFVMISFAPGGPMAAFEENPNLTPEDLARLEEMMGLNQPWYVRYWQWLTRVVQGDWGYSNVTHQPVMGMIAERLPNTLQLMGVAFVVTLLIALPIGILSALKQYSLFDHVATFLAFVGQSIPVFWFGLILIIVFNMLLNNPVSPSSGFAWSHFLDCADCKPLMPGGGMTPYDVDDPTFWQRIQHMILPVITLALFGAGTYTRYMRGQMLEVVHLDYMRTARSKGLAEKGVIWRHGLKNAITPVITVIALQLPILFGGALFYRDHLFLAGHGPALLLSCPACRLSRIDGDCHDQCTADYRLQPAGRCHLCLPRPARAV